MFEGKLKKDLLRTNEESYVLLGPPIESATTKEGKSSLPATMVIPVFLAGLPQRPAVRYKRKRGFFFLMIFLGKFFGLYLLSNDILGCLYQTKYNEETSFTF